MDMKKIQTVRKNSTKEMVTLLNLIHTEDSSDNDHVWDAYIKEAQRDYSLLLEWLHSQLKTSM